MIQAIAHHGAQGTNQPINGTIASDAPMWLQAANDVAVTVADGPRPYLEASFEVAAPAAQPPAHRAAPARCSNATAAKWLLGTTGLVAMGALVGLGIYLTAHGNHQTNLDYYNYRADFCGDNPYAYIGSMADCIKYWARQSSPQQVCDRANPTLCATFDTATLKDYSSMQIFGPLLIMGGLFAAPFVAALGCILSESCGATRNPSAARDRPSSIRHASGATGAPIARLGERAASYRPSATHTQRLAPRAALGRPPRRRRPCLPSLVRAVDLGLLDAAHGFALLHRLGDVPLPAPMIAAPAPAHVIVPFPAPAQLQPQQPSCMRSICEKAVLIALNAAANAFTAGAAVLGGALLEGAFHGRWRLVHSSLGACWLGTLYGAAEGALVLYRVAQQDYVKDSEVRRQMLFYAGFSGALGGLFATGAAAGFGLTVATRWPFVAATAPGPVLGTLTTIGASVGGILGVWSKGSSFFACVVSDV